MYFIDTISVALQANGQKQWYKAYSASGKIQTNMMFRPASSVIHMISQGSTANGTIINGINCSYSACWNKKVSWKVTTVSINPIHLWSSSKSYKNVDMKIHDLVAITHGEWSKIDQVLNTFTLPKSLVNSVV